jgi:cytochrome c oxidase subunit 2
MPSPVRRKTVVLLCVAVLGLVAAGAAVASNGGVAPPSPKSPNAGRITDVYWLLMGVTGAIFVIVESALLLFVFRFRNRGRSRDVEGPQIRGHTRLELIWTAIPVLILAGILVFVFYKLPGIKNVPSAKASGKPRLTIRVEGHQYYWNFRYPKYGVIQVNRMHAPADRVVELKITSADVDHSWWIPALDGKFDAIPGHTNTSWFRARRTGTYRGQCGEFCGLQHANMLARVQVMPPDEFDRWIANEQARQSGANTDLGKLTYRGACAVCHGLQGQGGYGRVLKDNPVTSDAKAVATIVRHGRNLMPAVGRGWKKKQLNALTAYLKQHFAPEGTASGG